MLQAIARFLYWMVAHFTMRTYGVHQTFRFVEGIWLHRESRQIRKKNWKRPISHNTCATYSELPSYISTMGHCLKKTTFRNNPNILKTSSLNRAVFKIFRKEFFYIRSKQWPV